MTRPRTPSNPDRWPTPCARCGEHHELVANWPDGKICAYCYQKAKRTTGTCRCGHAGVLPGKVGGAPACRTCSGLQHLNLDCRGCGAEAELRTKGKCWRCSLGDLVDELLANPETGTISDQLVPLASALKAMGRPNSGITWIRQVYVKETLRALAAADELTHELLDQVPGRQQSKTYIRGLLVEYGALPPRDELLSRFESWSIEAIERAADPAHRDAIRRYITWHHQRRLRDSPNPTTHGAFLRAKQQVTVAITLLNWLTDRNGTLAELTQTQLDRWRAEGTTTRELANPFLSWAIKAQLTTSTLILHRRPEGAAPRMSVLEQEQMIAEVSSGTKLTIRDRAAAILVVVFAQQIEHVVPLTWDQVDVGPTKVSIALGKTVIEIPPPLDEPFRELAAVAPSNTAAQPNSNWVFPGFGPGRHINAVSLRERLHRLFSPQAARLGTLHELTKLAPIAIIADALGYSTKTIERHARGAAATYAEYVATRE
jgi:hypothetical protein